MAEVVARGIQLQAGLSKLAHEHGCNDPRGRGLLWALHLPQERGPQVVELAREDGLLLNAPRPELLRFMPALNVSVLEINMMLAKLSGVLRAILH